MEPNSNENFISPSNLVRDTESVDWSLKDDTIDICYQETGLYFNDSHDSDIAIVNPFVDDSVQPIYDEQTYSNGYYCNEDK